ncbi:MAG: hypothetical protein WC875_04875, partial [Candidatus Absconditabacterales bacterium]
EGTKEERDKIRDIDAKYYKMYNEERRRRKRIAYYVCFIVLVCVFPVVIGWIDWYIIPISIAILLLGFIFADHEFIRYCSDEILKEGENITSLKNLASEKKDKMLRDDENLIRYFRYLKDETMKAVLDDYDFYSAGTYKRQKDEVERERRILINKIESSFSGRESLLSFTSSFQNLTFEFSREFSFNWGEGLDHTKICKVNMYEGCDHIAFRSYSYFPSYL